MLRGEAEVTGIHAAVPTPLIGFELGAIRNLAGKALQGPSPLAARVSKVSPILANALGFAMRPAGLGWVDEGKVRY